MIILADRIYALESVMKTEFVNKIDYRENPVNMLRLHEEKKEMADAYVGTSSGWQIIG